MSDNKRSNDRFPTNMARLMLAAAALIAAIHPASGNADAAALITLAYNALPPSTGSTES